MSRKDEFGRELQVDAKKSTRKLYQLEEVLQLTPGRFESAISEAPVLSKFSEQVGKYMGALLNSYGGIVRWGVTRTGLAKVKVIGTHCDRKMEDEYKVVVDCVAKSFSPRIDPSLYRLDFVQILRKSTNQPFREIRVIELRVQAGQELLYMDQDQRVRVVNGSTLYGPLIPQEIKRLVLKKYRKELLDSQSLLDVITPLVGRPLRAAVTPLLDRPPSGVSVDTQTSPAFCHGNGGNNSNVQATPIQSHINKSKVACLGTPMPSHIATSMVHSATPMQNHASKNNACSITPMHALVSNSKMSSPIETPKQNLQTALETSICTPFVGKESSSGGSDVTEGCDDLIESGAAEPKQNLQSVLETSASTPSVGKRSCSRAGATESCENVSEKPLTETRHTDTQNSPKLPNKQEKLSTEGDDVAQDEDARQGQDKTTSEGQDVPTDAAQDTEIPIIDLTGESPAGSRRRDSVGTFAHKLLEESLDAKKPSLKESESKENENPTGKETGSTSNSKTSLAERVKTFLQDVKQKIRPNSSKEEDTCPGKGSKVLKAEGNVKVKVGKKEEESERKRKQPAQRPALQNNQSQNRPGFTLTYHNKLYNQSYNQQSCNQQSYNQQTYNQRSYNQQSYNQPRTNQTYSQQMYNQQQSYSHLLQTAFSRNQAQSYNQADQYQMSFVARQFGNGSQGRYSSNERGVDSQNGMDWHNFYRLRQQAAIRDAWRSSYHD